MDEIPLPQMSTPADGANGGGGLGLIDTAIAPPNLYGGGSAAAIAASHRMPLPLHAHNHIALPPPALLQAPPPLGYAGAAAKGAAAAVPASRDDARAAPAKREPPGCPSGPPPSLLAMPELDSDYEESEPAAAPDTTAAADVKKPTSLQQRMLAISGQNIDEFMKEMENVQKKKELERAVDLHGRLAACEKPAAAAAGGSSASSDEDEDGEGGAMKKKMKRAENGDRNGESSNDDDDDSDDNDDEEDDDNDDDGKSNQSDDSDAAPGCRSPRRPNKVALAPGAVASVADVQLPPAVARAPPPAMAAAAAAKVPHMPMQLPAGGPPQPPIGMQQQHVAMGMPPMYRPPPPMRPMGIRMPPGEWTVSSYLKIVFILLNIALLKSNNCEYMLNHYNINLKCCTVAVTIILFEAFTTNMIAIIRF